MKTLAQFAGTFVKTIRINSPIISSVAAGAGTLLTAYSAARASFKAAEVIRVNEEKNGYPEDRKLRIKSRTGLVWKLYIPTAISVGGTIGCIVLSNRFSAQKIAAGQAALAFTERAYDQYRDKIVEEFGERKDRSVRDKVVAEQIAKNPPPAIVAGPGHVLCCELFTGRYFMSDMESLRKAVNDLNNHLLKQDYVTMDEWYYLIGLNTTSHSNRIGWRPDKLLELIFSSTLTEDGRPCITFEYNYQLPL